MDAVTGPSESFRLFVKESEPRLRHALVAVFGQERGLRGRKRPVGGHASVQAGRSISYQATPAGPARPNDGKTLNKPHKPRAPLCRTNPPGEPKACH